MNHDMQLTPHFRLSEFTRSQVATRRGINNDPPEPVIANLRQLAVLLEAVRVLLGGNPLQITSGYRCPMLNHVVNGAKHSAHLDGRAADFISPSYGTPLEVAQTLADSGLPYDKIIHEGGRWVHIQIPRAGQAPHRQRLTATFGGGGVTYTEGLA